MLSVSLTAQTTLLETGFEGPGFDEGWTMGFSLEIDEAPQDYPETGLDPWQKWDITETTGFGYVHSGDSAAWIGGSMNPEPKHDWLMTPVISVPEEGSTYVNYWLWYQSVNYYVNSFYIMIYDVESETWNEAYKLANDFNCTLFYTEPYSLDITTWKGKDIKVAFVKHGTYQMAMDDVQIVNKIDDDVMENVSSNFKVYPNPANDFITVELDNIFNNNILTISDATGREVARTSVTDKNSKIDISDLDSGLYFINVGDFRTKFIVK